MIDKINWKYYIFNLLLRIVVGGLGLIYSTGSTSHFVPPI